MLVDYLFLVAIGLDWLILALVLFGGKAFLSPSNESRKNFFKKSAFKILLSLLVLVFVIKILVIFIFGYSFKQLIVPESGSASFLIFILIQLLFAFFFLILGLHLFVKDGFKDEYSALWTKRISLLLVLTLFADFLVSLGSYLYLLITILPGDLKVGNLAVAYRALSANQYWLALGLILSLIVYFIFYLALKHQDSATTVTGMTISYLVMLLFSAFMIYSYYPLIAPDSRYLINDFILYLAIVLWFIILGVGVSSLLIIVMMYRKRKYLKNDFYFRYLLIRLSSFNAVAVVGFSVITFIPTLFFIFHR